MKKEIIKYFEKDDEILKVVQTIELTDNFQIFSFEVEWFKKEN